MINTYSKFYYGIEVTSDNKWLDIDEGSGEVSVAVPTGFYTMTDFAQAIEDALNDGLTETYTVTFTRATRIISIVCGSSVDYLASTGSNASISLWSLAGIASSDVTGTTVTGASAIGSSYSPQFKLQDYVSSEDSQALRESTVNKSASGMVEAQSFGTDRMIELSIKFSTDIPQPSGGPIVSNSSGVSDLRSFMQWGIKKAPFEFIPDTSSVSTFQKVVLESTPENSSGTAYKLKEQYGRGLSGYYETGNLTLRILED